MGRTATTARRTAEDYSELPRIKGRAGALEFITRELGVQVSPTMVRTATERRQLRVFKISASNWYSERDLYRWVLSLARGGDE